MLRLGLGQGLGLVVEQNGGQINPVKFFEDFKKVGEDQGLGVG